MRILKSCVILLMCICLVGCTSEEERNYNLGVEAMESLDWEAAIGYFTGLDYSDSKDLLSESQYQLGKSAMESQEWNTAIEYFTDSNHSASKALLAECKYELGTAAMDSQLWAEAIAYFSDTDHADSKELLKMCEREKGMRENSDYEFLDAIEESVNNRNKMSDEGFSLTEIVNAELAIIESYSSKPFYDSELNELAIKYIDGLNTQKEALDLKYSDHQIKWQEGLVSRYEVLCALHEQYGIFEDDTEFVSTYIAQLDNQKELLNAYRAIDDDLQNQFVEGFVFDYEDYLTASAPYTNNTKYDFDLIFYFTFYDDSGVRIDESTECFTNIVAGDACTLSFYWPENGVTCEFFWEIMIY